MVLFRLFISGLVAALFYGGWAWYANSLVTSDLMILSKAALVQGSYSGIVTLIFTALLEWIYSQIGTKRYCLALIVPRWSQPEPNRPCSTEQNFKQALASSEQKHHGSCIPGALLSPLPALTVQTIFVIGINWYFETPNLWLTVAPSIVFSAIYGYLYTLTLMRQSTRESVTNS